MNTETRNAADVRPGDTVLVPAHLTTRSTDGTTVTLTFAVNSQITQKATDPVLVLTQPPAPVEPDALGSVVPYEHETGESALLVKVGPNAWYVSDLGRVTTWEALNNAGRPLVEHVEVFTELNAVLGSEPEVVDQARTWWWYDQDGALNRRAEDEAVGRLYEGDAPFPAPPFLVS